jgi:hypothetical protein
LTWESFPDNSLDCCGGTGDIRRGVISDGVRLHSFGQWSPSTGARRPQAIGERPSLLNDAEAENIAANGEVLRVRTERGCRFVRLYRLN